MNFSLKAFKGSIPAGGQLDFNVYGDKVFAIDVPDGVKIKFDNGESVIFRTGLRYGVNGWFVSFFAKIISSFSGFPLIKSGLENLNKVVNRTVYNKISVINENANSVYVEFLAGFGDITDDSTIIAQQLDVVPVRNGVRTTKMYSISDGQTVQLIEGTGFIEDDYVIIKNYGDGNLLVGAGDFILEPGESLTVGIPFGLEVTASGGNVQCGVIGISNVGVS